MSVIDYQPEHRGEMIRLFRNNFGDWAADRFMMRSEWQSGDGNPWRGLRASSGLLGFHDGKLVAGMAMFPIPLLIHGERRIVLCGGEFAIDSLYRMRIFPQLVDAFLDRQPVIANGLHPAIWAMGLRRGAHGIPMSKARQVLQLRNHGRICRAIRRGLPALLAQFVTPEMLAKFFPHGPAEVLLSRMLGRTLGLFKRRLLPGNASDADIRSLDRFGKSYDALWEKMRGNFSITVDKNSEYLNWRYFDCPTLREPVVHGLYEDGELAGVIVAAAYSTLDRRRKPCGRNGEILELIAAGASSSGIEALVLSASKLLDAKMVDKIGILCNEPYMQEALRGIGFCPQEDRTFDCMFLFDKADASAGGDRVESLEGLYITAGDGDMLTASLI